MHDNKRNLTTQHRMNKVPRKAYCTGCEVTFGKMHELINHRRLNKCGGRFLPPEKRTFLEELRRVREAQLRQERFMAAMEAL